MKKCPFCAEEIQDAAILCRYCNRDLPPTALVPPAPTGQPFASPKAYAIGIAVLGLIMWGIFSIGSDAVPTSSGVSRTNSAAAAVLRQPTLQGPALALIAARGYEAEFGGFHYVEGQVKNISNGSLENVAVVASWYDKDGNFITSDQALIDYNPILPDQTSPFKTITTGNPAMARFAVEFKELLRGTIAHRDDRRAAPPRPSPTAGGERRQPPSAPEESTAAWLPSQLELRIERSANQWRITNEQEYRWSNCTASVGLSEAPLGTLEQNNTILVFDSDFKPRVADTGAGLAITCRVGRDRSFTTTRPWNTEQ